MHRERRLQRWLATTCAVALLLANQTAQTATITAQAQISGVQLAQSDESDRGRRGDHDKDRRRGDHRPGGGAKNHDRDNKAKAHSEAERHRGRDQRGQAARQQFRDERRKSSDQRHPETRRTRVERSSGDDNNDSRQYSRPRARHDERHRAGSSENYRHHGDRDGYRQKYGHHGYFVPRYRRHVYQVPPRRIRHYRDVIIVRPHGHWYHGYGHHHDDASAYSWLAFTAISLGILTLLSVSQQRTHEQAQIYATRAPVGETIYWRDRGASGSVTPLRDGYAESGLYCREFQQRVTIGGRSEEAYGTACQQPDGAWKIVGDAG